jgi:hypothetical protein
MIGAITKIYLRHYRDNGQRTLYVEWKDSHGKSGRTECDAGSPAKTNTCKRFLLAVIAKASN